jgi:hypothetical protein
VEKLRLKHQLKIICDGCDKPITLQLQKDMSDPGQGMLVWEQFFGTCEACDLSFFTTVFMMNHTHSEKEGEGGN